MKLAIASAGDNLDAQADPRFGRCAYYIIVDSDTLEFEAIENAAAMQGSGAGIAAAQMVAGTGAEAVVAGNFGPNAFQALGQGGLQLFQGSGGTVRQIVEAFNAGQLQPVGGATAASKSGMGGGAAPAAGMGMGGGMGTGGGRGMGMGGGRGMGMGGGRGMGMGGGAGMGPGMSQPPQQPQAPPAASEADMKTLKDEIVVLQQQVKELLKSLSDKAKE